MSVEHTPTERLSQALEEAKEAKRRLMGSYGNMMAVGCIGRAVYELERAIRYVEIAQEDR